MYQDKEPTEDPPDALYFDPEDIQRWLSEDPYYQEWLDMLEAKNDYIRSKKTLPKRASSF